uniref:Transmembrane protein n=1 Tax=Caenorhabditis japonica TaxID=281687 RepID=A0A8R1IMW8_CAEJA
MHPLNNPRSHPATQLKKTKKQALLSSPSHLIPTFNLNCGATDVFEKKMRDGNDKRTDYCIHMSCAETLSSPRPRNDVFVTFVLFLFAYLFVYSFIYDYFSPRNWVSLLPSDAKENQFPRLVVSQLAYSTPFSLTLFSPINNPTRYKPVSMYVCMYVCVELSDYPTD